MQSLHCCADVWLLPIALHDLCTVLADLLIFILLQYLIIFVFFKVPHWLKRGTFTKYMKKITLMDNLFNTINNYSAIIYRFCSVSYVHL